MDAYSAPGMSSGDSGSQHVGPNLDSHLTGNPIPQATVGQVTVGHTWVIIAGALVLLWILGGVVFRSIRM